MNNVTSLAALATDEATQIFAGTGSGVVIAPFLLSLPQQPPSDHRYFSGPRWLASHSADADENSVLHLAAFTGKGWSTGIVGGGGGVWCVTRKGLSLLEAVPMTLQKKADHLQVQLRSPMPPLPTARALGTNRPRLQAIGDLRHDRLVGFSGGCSLQTWGDATTCVDFDEDNDGLWTSVCAALSLKENSLLFIVACRYTAGLAYKYAVTQDEDDRQRALHRFYAIAFLHNVTGIKGARQPSVSRRPSRSRSALRLQDWSLDRP